MKTLTPKQAGERQRATIEASRKLLKTSPVKLAHVPTWMKNAIRKVDPDHPLLVGTSQQGWLDHWGSISQAQMFVSEPYTYNFHTSTILEIEAFCRRFGFTYAISANSWHYPGATIRIIIMKR